MAQSALLGSTEGFEWLRAEFADICAIVTRREETNFDEKTGLFFWDDAMQSGADNNAADSNLPELKSLFLSCDMNTFQWKEYSALAKIAEELGLPFETFQQQADSIKTALHEYLWNDELSCFDNKRRDTGAFVQCISYSNFVPLWAGLADKKMACLMIDSHLLNQDHLMTEWGARSLSKQDRAYHNANIIIPYSNWSGPIWPIANYFYHCGLLNYGYKAEAKDLAERVARLILTDLDTIGSMHESYCAETGATLAPSSDQAPRFIEGGFIGWNLLVQDMLEAGES